MKDIQKCISKFQKSSPDSPDDFRETRRTNQPELKLLSLPSRALTYGVKGRGRRQSEF